MYTCSCGLDGTSLDVCGCLGKSRASDVDLRAPLGGVGVTLPVFFL